MFLACKTYEKQLRIEKTRLSHQVWSHGGSTFKKKKDIKRPFFPPCRNWPICITWSSWPPRSTSWNRSKVAKLFCCFVSPHLVRKFSTELDVNAKPAQNIRWKHLQAHYFFSSQRSDRGQNGQSEVSKQDKRQQGKGEREKVCERNVYFHSSPPPQDLSCLLVLSPLGSASTSQSINLVWSKACLQ